MSRPEVLGTRMEKIKRNIRIDIQGLRGIAIIGVLLFHMFPESWPRGFLGVDVFFVISGFLIARILSHDETDDTFSRTQLILNFYCSRFLRIVPDYAVMLGITVFAARWFFAPIDFEFLASSWSPLYFAKNLQEFFHANDYWAQTSDFSPFLHAWSLGVEIQFYLIAPAIQLIISCSPSQRFRYLFILAISSTSLLIYAFSNANSRFYLLQCRSWQFFLGFIAEMSTRETVKPSQLDMQNTSSVPVQSQDISYLSALLTASLYGILFLQTPIDNDAARLTVSVVTMGILIVGSVNQGFILTNWLPVYIGDRSYSLYLIHWPCIVVYKYNIQNANASSASAIESICVMSFAFIGILRILELLNNFVEDKITRVKFNIFIVTTIYALILGNFLIPPTLEEIRNINNTSTELNNTDNRSAVLNWVMTNRWINGDNRSAPDEEAMKWTGYLKPKHIHFSFLVKGTGHLSVLLLGNSFAFESSSMIDSVFQDQFSKLRVFGEMGCPVLTQLRECPQFRAAFTKIIKEMKPDIVWVVAKEPAFFEYSQQELHQQVSSTVSLLRTHARRIVINGQHDYHAFKYDPWREMVRRLQLGRNDFQDMQLPREEHDLLHKKEWELMNSFTSEEILFNNVADQLCETDYCPFYDPRTLHIYYNDKSGHLNQAGQDRLRPGYVKLARQLIDDLRV